MASLQHNGYQWYVFWREPVAGGRARLRRRPVGPDRAVAERALAEFEAARRGERRVEQVRELLRLAGLVEVAAPGWPVGQLWEVYAATEQARALSPRSRQSKAALWRGFLGWLEGRYPDARLAQQVTERMAAEWLATFADAAGSTRNNAHSVLRSIWAACRIGAGLTANPFAELPRARARSVRKLALTLAQARALFAAAVAKGGWWPAAVALGYHCGMRWGDVCQLRWEELDLAAGLIRFADAKTARYGRGELELALPPDFGRWLPTKGGRGEVWPALARQHAASAGSLGEELRELFAAAGLEMWRAADAGETRRRQVQQYGFHSLRHTFVTLLRESGMHREEIADLVGHGSPVMTARYDHSKQAAKEAARRLEGLDTVNGTETSTTRRQETSGGRRTT